MPSNGKDKRRRAEATRQYKTTRTRKPSRSDDGKTKRVSTSRKEEKRRKKKDKNKFSSRHPKLMLIIKILIILILLLCVVGAGIVAALFFGVFGDDFEITKEELEITTANSVVLDINGNLITDLSKDQSRKIITLDEMAEYLPKAYVAIEDKRFYEHDGVDLKRTGGAIINTIFKGSSSYGGSTITQQLVKNITNEKESSGMAGILRKVKEWAKAYQVERMISKQQILELYLNILFVGGRDIHGVELGAQYYFSKSAKDLDLAECAFLAGINSSPASYNPFTERTDEEKAKLNENIKNKVLTVLSEMKSQGYIENEEDYTAAVAKAEAGLEFKKGDVESSASYSYHTDAALKQIINQVMEEKNVTREFAEKYVYSSGFTIYTTMNPDIQARVEQEFAKPVYQVKGHEKNADGSLKNEHSQAGMAIIDYKTGQVVAVGGNLGDAKATGWNRATQMVKQTGSSIKPIADVAPALQERVITAATKYNDVKTDFGGGYSPKDDGEHYLGKINVRQFIASSQNVPAVKIMRELTPKKSIEYLKKMGISTLVEDGAENDLQLPLAIGGLTKGISPLEMAAAYGTIANDGVYIEPTFYTKVLDSSGNEILTPKQEQQRVLTEQVAYITRSIIEEPVKAGGTAPYCAITGMETCAKTGTTDKSYDRWLCGMTPYYSAATWFGYDNSEEVKWSGYPTNPAGAIWSNIMKDIHKNLKNANFNTPSGIVQETVCRLTGCLATSSCSDTYSEMFTQDNLPSKCEGHGIQKICAETGKEATEYCPTVKNNSYGGVLPKESLGLWTPSSKDAGGRVTEKCPVHTKPAEPEKKPEETPKNETNKTNTTGGNNTTSGGNTAGGNTTAKPSGGNETTKPSEEKPSTNTTEQGNTTQ